MSTIEKQVRAAQRRLWLNRWLTQWGWSLAGALVVWILAWLVNRLFGLYAWPVTWTLGGAAVLSLIVASIWTMVTREAALEGAVALDKAAGLRERVSTSLNLDTNSKDPFEAAVVRDATARITGLAPKKLLPVRWPGSLSLSSIVVLVALLSLLLPEFDLLGRKNKDAGNEVQAGIQSRNQVVLAKVNNVIDKIADENKIDLEADGKRQPKKLDGPRREDKDVMRRETIKKLDRLQDALKQKMGDEKFEALRETKKQLRQIGEPADTKNEMSELISAMARNDFSEAQEAVKKLQEKLAKRAEQGGASNDEVKKMKEQMNQLAQKLQEAARKSQEKKEEQQTRDLQNAGMSKEDAKRTLEQLSKKDPEQLKKMAQELAERMKDKGVTQEQMQKMLEKMQQEQKNCEKGSQQCEKMGQQMQKAAEQLQKGDQKGAQKELGETGEQLNEMEQMEQALNELNSQMSELDQQEQEMQDKSGDQDGNEDDLACKQCDGSGFKNDGSPCPGCNKQGQNPGKGQGNRGRGAADRDRDDSAQTGTVDRKANVKQGKGGGIVGQTYVKDKQLKGESNATITDAEAASEIDDTDAIGRERIPPLYKKGVKRFFDRSDDRGESKPKSEEKTEGGEKKDDADSKD